MPRKHLQSFKQFYLKKNAYILQPLITKRTLNLNQFHQGGFQTENCSIAIA